MPTAPALPTRRNSPRAQRLADQTGAAWCEEAALRRLAEQAEAMAATEAPASGARDALLAQAERIANLADEIGRHAEDLAEQALLAGYCPDLEEA